MCREKNQGGPGEGSGDHTPKFLLGSVQADRADREIMGITPADYGKRWKSAYAALLGERPACLGMPGDQARAREYLARIVAAIRKHGWTPGERRRLKDLRELWQKRASGMDARFLVVGTRGGRETPEERRQVESLKRILEVVERRPHV